MSIAARGILNVIVSRRRPHRIETDPWNLIRLRPAEGARPMLAVGSLRIMGVAMSPEET